jgi:hypothetical protein
MSTPNKFCMGGMPRTATGLVPASYKSKLESLSCQKEWSPLPKQPRPEMFVYRGDYINARNRKLQAEKAAKKQPLKKSPVRAKSKSDGGLKPINTNVTDGPAFDTYCQHISTTKLSKREADARTTNKQRFLDYMRSEQSKRATRDALEKKLQEELSSNENNDAKQEVVVATKPRKPPVPRLSYFAKTGKRTKSEMASKLKAQGNGEKKEVDEAKPKPRSYLEFISKKSEKQVSSTLKQQAEKDLSVDAGMESDRLQVKDEPIEETNVEYDAFRLKIEAIVEKAAAAVMMESAKDTMPTHEVNSSTPDETASTTAFSWLVNSQRSIDQWSYETESKCDTQQSTQESELSHANDRLRQLEERIKCLSLGSSSIYNDLKSDEETINSEVTFQGKTFDANKKGQARLLEHIEDHSVSYGSWNTEIFPRAHIQPTQFPVMPTSKLVDKSMGKVNGSFDSFSWSVSLSNDSQPATDMKRLNTEELCKHRVCAQQHAPSMPPCIQPYAQPQQSVDWGEEPMPRGFEHLEANSRENEFQVADDILSLL